MNELVFIKNEEVVTDSLTVADTFNKNHSDVMRDIRKLDCSDEFRVSNFADTPYKHRQNKQSYRKYIIKQDGFSFLVMGYTGKEAARFKEMYIKEFNRMKDQLIQPKLPKNYKEALQDLLGAVEDNEKLQKENDALEKQNESLKPKAEYTDMILQNSGLVTIESIAKDYGYSARKMNELLNELGVQYKRSGQWFLYRKYDGQGYVHSSTFPITRTDGTPDVSVYTKWTQKGRLFLYQFLKERDIVPLIEKDDVRVFITSGK